MKQSMGWWGVAMGRCCSRGTMCQLCRVRSADLMYNNVTIINNKKITMAQIAMVTASGW